ncbi:heat shock protein 30 [Immersiella caudata]|uniref:Heat shock protein 30 n=1 Tax=Immersiella caudata TaxID=314043 RepID=A0AA39WEC4_9PEZI|nr:heat shock protein 30 [Immersiella caudata]
MAVLNIRVNDALTINPPAGDQFYTVNGSNWSWTVAAVYTLTFAIVYALSFKARAGEKFFHYLFTVANLVGAITYFALASDIGFSVVEVSNNLNYGLTRQIFFAKYINWVVNFPIAIISLGVLSGVSWTTIIYNIFLSWTWIISYLVGAYTTTNYKWGFFTFGTVAWIALAISTLTTGLSSAARVEIRRDYVVLAGWLNLLWLLYPIAWGLSDGGNKIGVTPSFVFFGVLDILLIPVLTYATIVLSRKWDYGKLNIAFTQYGRVASAPGTFPEKAAPAPAATAAV